jgi:hypothetical protein
MKMLANQSNSCERLRERMIERRRAEDERRIEAEREAM